MLWSISQWKTHMDSQYRRRISFFEQKRWEHTVNLRPRGKPEWLDNALLWVPKIPRAAFTHIGRDIKDYARDGN
jgi:hypothetical protein